MPQSLLDLPNEILTEVFSHLDTTHLRPCDWDPEIGKYTSEEYTNSRPSLCAVARVNRRLHQITRPLLLEEVSLFIESSGPRCPPGLEFDAVRFTDHCMKHPAILEHMKKFHLWWRAPTPDAWSTNLLNTVSLAPNLAILEIECLDDYTSTRDRTTTLGTLVSQSRQLEVFVANLPGVEIPLSLIQKIFDMPHLRSFESSCSISRVEAPWSESAVLEMFEKDVIQKRHYETRLGNLCLTGEYLDITVLRHFFLRYPRLKKLTLSLPGSGLCPYYGPPHSANESTHLFQPCSTTRILSPCASSLVELSVTNHGMKLSQTDNTTIDLSSFSHLRRLTLSNRMLCKVTNHGSGATPCLTINLPGNEWYKALPIGLEFLQIQFDCSGGLLWNLMVIRLLENEYNTAWVMGDVDAQTEALGKWHSEFEMKYFKPRVSREIEKASFHQLSWIMDSAEAMRERFQHLADLKVIENVNVPVDGCGCTWDLVDLVGAYPEQFNVPGLDLELSVRVPRQYVPPPLDTIKPGPADGASRNSEPEVTEMDLLRALEAQETRQQTYARLLDSMQAETARAWGNDD